MPRWGMAADLDRCTGCGACVTACHAENNISTVGPEQASLSRAKHWIRVERYWEGEFPDVKLKFRPVMCQQCNNPPWEKPLHLQLNPDVSLRETGVMEKCTFCVQRIKGTQIAAKAENRAVRDGEIQPSCAQACPSRALVFGDLEDPESEVSRLAESPRGSKLLEDLGTR